MPSIGSVDQKRKVSERLRRLEQEYQREAVETGTEEENQATELIENGGFEDGLTGWTNSGWNLSDYDDGSGGWEPHSGIWYIWGYSALASIEQTFAATATSLIENCGFWCKLASGGPAGSGLNVYLLYSDSSEESFEDVLFPTDTWTWVDLLSSLNPAKSLIGIRITWFNSYYMLIVDDVSILRMGD